MSSSPDVLGVLAPLVEAVARRTADLVTERLAGRLPATPAPAPEQLLDVRETARRLAVTPAAVYKLAESGSLPSVKLGGRLRFRVADIEGYVADHVRSDETVVDLARAVRARELPR